MLFQVGGMGPDVAHRSGKGNQARALISKTVFRNSFLELSSKVDMSRALVWSRIAFNSGA